MSTIFPRTVYPPHEATGTDDALRIAIEALAVQCAQTDTASPDGVKWRAAHTTLEMILAQRGCEHFGADCPDGMLTTLIDTVVFG